MEKKFRMKEIRYDNNDIEYIIERKRFDKRYGDENGILWTQKEKYYQFNLAKIKLDQLNNVRNVIEEIIHE